MSAYPFPKNSSLSVFNPIYFLYGNDNLTIKTANQRYLQLAGGRLSGGLTTNAGINNTAGNIVLNSTALRFKDNLNNNNSILYLGGGTNGLVVAGENQLFLNTTNTGGTIVNNRITNFNDAVRIGSNGNNINNLQSGKVSNSGSTLYTITFPNAYGSVPNVITTLIKSSSTASFYINVQSITATDFTYRLFFTSLGTGVQINNVTDAHDVSWIAFI